MQNNCPVDFLFLFWCELVGTLDVNGPHELHAITQKPKQR